MDQTRIPSCERSIVHRLSRRRFLGLVAGAAGSTSLVSLLAACAPSAPPPQPTSAPPRAAEATRAPAAQPTAATAAEPTRAPVAQATKPAAPQPTAAPAARYETDQLTIALTPDLITFNPWTVSHMPQISTQRHIFEALNWREARSPSPGGSRSGSSRRMARAWRRSNRAMSR